MKINKILLLGFFMINLAVYAKENILSQNIDVESMLIPKEITLKNNIFFDKNKYSVQNKYTIISNEWLSLKHESRILISSSGFFFTIHFIFKENNEMQIIIGHTRLRGQNIYNGQYKINKKNNILFIRIQNMDFVYHIEYLISTDKENRWKNAIQLYYYNGANWDMSIEEILTKEKKYYDTLVK
ncbi:MAG: hypothetical protein LBT51_00490 [Fusobacteriaceae bacterium]|nr:hypothetical protein [Fusobacteriaceae bacterium]